MRHGHASILLATVVCIGVATGCEDVTAPEAARAIAELEEQVEREWIADPRTFPDFESLWMVAEMARHGADAVPVTITIDGRERAFKAIAYESANDPFQLTPEGRITVWRRGLILWRGTPAEEVVGIWARAPDSVARPSLLLDPTSEGIFGRPSAYRVRRDTTVWRAVEGVVAVGDPVSTGPCRFRDGNATPGGAARRTPQPIACTNATFDASFDLVFERYDATITGAVYEKMLVNEIPALPFRGASPSKVSLARVSVPGVRFLTACGTAHGAPNDSTCLSTDAPPSP